MPARYEKHRLRAASTTPHDRLKQAYVFDAFDERIHNLLVNWQPFFPLDDDPTNDNVFDMLNHG